MLLLAGCITVELYTKVTGASERRVAVSGAASLKDRLIGIPAAGLPDTLSLEGKKIVVDERQQFDERGYVAEGRYHRIFTKRFHNVRPIAGRMVQSAFRHVLAEDSLQVADKVDFDIYRSFFTTTYTYSETLHVKSTGPWETILRPEIVSRTKGRPVEIYAAIEMPGEILDAQDAERVEGRVGHWKFEIAPEDTARDMVISIRSGKQNFWTLASMGILILVFLFYLPRAFMRQKAEGKGQRANVKREM